MSKVISRALAAALVFLGVPAEAQAPRMPLGLMGTIPIYWGEAQQFGDLIDGEAATHWARAELERAFFDILHQDDLATGAAA